MSQLLTTKLGALLLLLLLGSVLAIEVQVSYIEKYLQRSSLGLVSLLISLCEICPEGGKRPIPPYLRLIITELELELELVPQYDDVHF